MGFPAPSVTGTSRASQGPPRLSTHTSAVVPLVEAVSRRDGPVQRVLYTGARGDSKAQPVWPLSQWSWAQVRLPFQKTLRGLRVRVPCPKWK